MSADCYKTGLDFKEQLEWNTSTIGIMRAVHVVQALSEKDGFVRIKDSNPLYLEKEKIPAQQPLMGPTNQEEGGQNLDLVAQKSSPIQNATDEADTSRVQADTAIDYPNLRLSNEYVLSEELLMHMATGSVNVNCGGEVRGDLQKEANESCEALRDVKDQYRCKIRKSFALIKRFWSHVRRQRQG